MLELHIKILSFRRKQLQTRLVGLMNDLESVGNGSGIRPLVTGTWDTIVRRNFYSIESTLLQSKYPGSFQLFGRTKKLSHLIFTTRFFLAGVSPPQTSFWIVGAWQPNGLDY